MKVCCLWGHARDYIEMQWLMLQQSEPEDFVIATGQQYSVRDFVTIAANELGINIIWSGSGLNEVGSFNGKDIVKVDSNYFRPTEVETLLGDPSKAKKKLGWEPRISFESLVSEMIKEDLKKAKTDELIKNSKFN